MERLIDKGILALCCLATFAFMRPGGVAIAGFLLALACAGFCEAVPLAACRVIAAAYSVAALAVPEFAAFLPLVAYDCVRDDLWPVRLMWLVPALASLRLIGQAGTLVLLSLLFCAVAVVLSIRTTLLVRERANSRVVRDSARENSIALEERNRSLQEARDLSVRVATLDERSRIAREIHDNAGHLITRAIMQVEAMKVVHADEPAAEDFARVGETLQEAMQTMRASVHNLRDEALDVESQMREALDGCGVADAVLAYEVDELPPEVGLCFLAIVREALSNTVRHSDATSVAVSVREYPGLYQLEVRDNGTGDSKPSSESTGMGLQTMDDRVHALGGTLRTERSNGFRVFASVPRQRER